MNTFYNYSELFDKSHKSRELREAADVATQKAEHHYNFEEVRTHAAKGSRPVMCQDQFGPHVSAKITHCLKSPVLTNTFIKCNIFSKIPKFTSLKYSTMIVSVLISHTYGDETTKVKDMATARQSRTGW